MSVLGAVILDLRALTRYFICENTLSGDAEADLRLSFGCCCGSIILNHISAVEDAVEVH